MRQVTDTTILKRNARLLKFFELLDLDVKIIGNMNTPAVILNNKKVLNCYAHNFDLVFTDSPKDGEELFRHKLNHRQEFTKQDKEEIYNWIFANNHRECFRINLEGTPLYLAGYNNKNRHDKRLPRELYPVFAEYDYKLYFSKESAQEKAAVFSTDELTLIVE